MRLPKVKPGTRLSISLLLVLILCFTGCEMTPDQAKAKAYKLYDEGKYKESMDCFEKAFTGEIDDPEFLVRYSYCLIANEFDPKYAIEMLFENVQRFPDYARSYYMLGHIASRFSPAEGGRNITQALRFMRRAAELDTLSVAVMTDMARYYILLNQLDSAQIWCRKALTLDPDNQALRDNLQDLRELMQVDSAAFDNPTSPTAADSLEVRE